MKTAVVFNAAAGGGAPRRREGLVAHCCAGADTQRTRYAGHAIELARQFVRQGYDCIVAAGGDGTVNEVVNGMFADGPTRAVLGVLPLGSACDFARSLGLPRGAAAAAAVLAREKIVAIDVARARFSGNTRYFVNVASLGLGAEVILRMKTSGRSYLFQAVRALPRYRARNIVLNGEAVEAIHIAIGNGSRQGSGMLVCPGASLTDGLLDITTMAPVSLWELARNLPILYNGRIHSHPKVRHFRSATLSAACDDPVAVELDGDPAGALPVDIDVLPEALRVIVP